MDNGANGEEDEQSKPRLERNGSVVVVSIPGAPKISQELNEWIRKGREREV